MKNIFDKLLRPDSITAFTIALLLVCGISAVAISQHRQHGNDGQQKQSAGRLHMAVSAIDLDGPSEKESSSLKPLGESLATYLERSDPDYATSSIYIEDLDEHTAVNVGETKQYNAKSLMKVPVVMTLYRMADYGRLDLDEDIELTQSELNKNYGDLWKKGAGYKLTLREAARLALEDSDNTAVHAINDHLNPVAMDEDLAYNFLGLDVRIDDNSEAYLSAQTYATILRCLYTVCYNNKADTAEMLKMMEHSDWTAPNGLIPPGTRVAHKIGSVGNDGFNDCGIVYGPKKPFIYCTMLTATEQQAAMDVAQIVKLSYDYLEK